MTDATYASLRNKAVFVTGGASGIGADIVRAFAGQGARVGFVDIQTEAGAALVQECDPSGQRVCFEACDITDIAAFEAAIDTLTGRLGHFTVLVNNAANDQRMGIDDVTVEDWDWSFNINLRPQYFAAKALRPGMRAAGGGSIINMSSIAWRFGGADMAPYASAKAGVVGLTLALARAYGRDNIRVNAIEPGAVITERQRRLWFPDPAKIDAVVARQLMQRILEGRDIAKVVLFLASDDSEMITKQTLAVDAGLR